MFVGKAFVNIGPASKAVSAGGAFVPGAKPTTEVGVVSTTKASGRTETVPTQFLSSTLTG